MKNIFLVDDSPHLVENLCRLIKSIPGLVCSGSVGSVVKAVDVIIYNRPDIIILDISLEDGCGIDIIQSIKKELPGCVIIMFTNHNNEVFQKKSISLGANYFLDKTKDIERLIDVLKILAK